MSRIASTSATVTYDLKDANFPPYGKTDAQVFISDTTGNIKFTAKDGTEIIYDYSLLRSKGLVLHSVTTRTKEAVTSVQYDVKFRGHNIMGVDIANVLADGTRQSLGLDNKAAMENYRIAFRQGPNAVLRKFEDLEAEGAQTVTKAQDELIDSKVFKAGMSLFMGGTNLDMQR